MELFHSIVRAFGWSVLNSLWQGAIIYVLLFILLYLTPKLSATKRHNLAYLSLSAIFLWFMITFFSQISWNKSTTEVISFSEVAFNFRRLPLTYSEQAEIYFPYLLVLYAFGIIGQLTLLGKGLVTLQKLKNNGLSEVPAEWNLKFDAVFAALGLTRNIRFQLSDLVRVPIVVGFLKPMVLFPVCLISQLDTDQVEAILIHELSHIRRNDYLLNLIKTTVETLLFFNPFVWLTRKFIHIEREHACDDLVLSLGAKPLTYVHALLTLEIIQNDTKHAFALAATGKTQHLYHRIKRITNMKTNYVNLKQQLAALTLAIAGLASVAWVNPEVKATAKAVTKQITESPVFKLIKSNQIAQLLPQSDTSKKKIKMKITITADDGKTKEYNSIAELPDSVRRSLSLTNRRGNFVYVNGINLFDQNRDSLQFNPINDSLRVVIGHTLTGNLRSVKGMELNPQWEELSKELRCPETIVKLKKFREELLAKKNSPETIQKWNTFRNDLSKEFTSPEAQAKWKKMNEELQRQFKYQALTIREGDKLNKITTVNFTRGAIDSLVGKLPSVYAMRDGSKIVVDGKRLYNYKYRVAADGQRITSTDTIKYINNNKIYQGNGDFGLNEMVIGRNISLERDLENNEAYKKLRAKFQKDVEALRKKAAEKKKNN